MTATAKFLRGLSVLFFTLLTVAGCAAVAVSGLFFVALRDLPQVPEPLNRIIETPPTEIFAASGERIMILGGREAVPLSQVSPHFIQAVIATEDHRFWDHHGLDKMRTLKALYITLFEPGRIQGASTITQQLAKNLFFSQQRTFIRKFRELLVALQIESQYSKREILEAYLNQIPFGVGAQGIEQASRAFFGKPASDLNLAESALLAGLPKSPTRYNPFLHYDRAKVRQQVVLSRMVKAGYISLDEADRAGREELRLQARPAERRSGSYFLDVVLKMLEDRYGPDVLYHGGLKVMTTLDPQMQNWAVESVRAGVAKVDELVGSSTPAEENLSDDATRPQAALVAVEVNSGAVRALVGGRDYAETEYNRAVQSNRLPGSGFKPFLYYAALENPEITPATVFVDRQVSIAVPGAADWTPQNYAGRFRGPLVLKRALMDSVNSIAAQLIEKTGPEAVIDVARRCGITSPMKPVYSLALGTSGVSPMEMASAFATFASGGIRHEPFFISRVEDPLGRVLEEHILNGRRTLDADLTYQVVDMMKGVLDGGTGATVRALGFNLPAAGKTGTTDDFYDAWFTGFTPTLCTSVWVGLDREVGLRDKQGLGISGSRAAAPIWANFMIKATGGEPPRDFSMPADIHFETVDSVTGDAVEAGAVNALRVALRKGQRVPEAWGAGSDIRLPDRQDAP
jgi:1A family penicillin-binding protein